MKDQVITFETAKLAEKMGFNWGTNEHYFVEIKKEEGSLKIGDLVSDHFDSIYDLTMFNPLPSTIIAPTQSFLQRWLRENHNIHIYVCPVWENEEVAKDINSLPEYQVIYTYDYMLFEDIEEDIFYFKTYEQALEVGLQEALKLIE